MSQQRKKTPPQFKLPLIRVSGEASPNNYLQKSNQKDEIVTAQKSTFSARNTQNLNKSFQGRAVEDQNFSEIENNTRRRRASASEQKNNKLRDAIETNIPQKYLSKDYHAHTEITTQNGIWRPHQLQTQQLKDYLEEMEMKDKIKFNIKFYDIIPKFKAKRILKYWVIALRAVIRLRKLVSSLLTKKKQNINLFNICIQEVIYNDQLKTIKFKQWTQMVFSKVISTIKRENLTQSLNIIDDNNTHSQNYDMARLKLSQLLKLMLDGLLLMTSQYFFLKELACEMYVQQFENHKKNFYIFTSLRTNYLKQTRDDLPLKEQAMIFTEFIFIILVNNLAIISQTEIAFNYANEASQFLVKLLISFLQYLFFNSFYKLKTKPLQSSQSFTQNSILKRKRVGFEIIQSPLFGEAQEIVSGTFNISQLKPLLDQTRWLSLMKSNFNQIIRNLQQFNITQHE